jgi:hypothetical protein
MANYSIVSAKVKEKKFTPIINYNNNEDLYNGDIKYSILNLDELKKYLGLNRKVLSANAIFFSDTSNNSIDTAQYVSASTLYWGQYLTNIIGPNVGYGLNIVGEQTAFNNASYPIDKTITISTTVSNTYSTQISSGIEIGTSGLKGTISSSVGFDVGYSQTYSDSTTINDMAPFTSVTVKAYPIYNFYNFNIWAYVFPDSTNARYVGLGSAGQVIGLYTVVLEN